MHYSLTRATLWNLAGYFYLIIASLIATPILVHSLGLTLFGQYSLILATLGLVSTLNLGLPQAVVRALSQNKSTKLWATSLILFVSTGLVAGFVSTLITSYLNLEAGIIFLVFVISFLNNLHAHYQTLSHSEGHFGYFNAKTFIVGTGNTLLAAYLAWAGQGITAILSSQLLCYLFTLLPLTYFSLKFFPRPWTYLPSKSVAKSLLKFGLKNQVGTLAGQIQSQYAKYLLATISPLHLSSYVITQGIVQKLSGGVTQIATALYPLSVRSNLRPLYYRLQFCLLGISLLGVIAYRIWGLEFLEWWLSAPELVNTINSLAPLFIWYFGILILTPLASTVLDSRGRPELTSLYALITTASEIILALILFPRYGLFAPVYSALIAISLTTPFLLYSTERVLKSKL